MTESKQKFQPGKFHCNYCNADISSTVYVTCAICKEYDLCLDCHMVGAEAPPHSNTHSYRIVDDHAQPIYTESWSLNEEYLLLESIQLMGIGNWEGVGNHIGRDPKDCEIHYWRLYYNSEEKGLSEKPVFLCNDYDKRDIILENQSNYKNDPMEDIETNNNGDQNLVLLSDPKNLTRNDILKDDLGMPLFVCKERNIKPHFIPFERPKKNDKENDIGWNPLRKSFSILHDNAAEEYVGGYDIDENDIPEKAELKIKMLEIFEHIMQERDRRINFILERGLQDVELNESNYRDAKSKRLLLQTDPEKYELEMYRSFARFITGEEYEKLIDLLKKEKEVRRRLKEFKNFRENGITRQSDVEQFEIENRKKRAVNARKAGRSRIGTIGGTAPTTDEAGFEMMVFSEQRICGKLNMSPAQYLVVKDALIRESFILGTLSRKTAFSLFSTVEQDKIDRIFDYLVEAQMIHEEKG